MKAPNGERNGGEDASNSSSSSGSTATTTIAAASTSTPSPGETSKPTTNGNPNSCSQIKASLSMTSLPPDEQQQLASEVIKAKLRVERPYNSLKKKRNSDSRDTWRHSWGSGHSHSSCSLHSNATVGLSSGKDEFWAALQTNYNYIMDTNLLDSCKEARCEIEGAADVTTNKTDCCYKMLESSRTEGSSDPKELRKWLREMENKISNVPSLLEATHMSIEELQKRLTDHSVLYCEIVSHARVVGACIRASEKEANNSSCSSAEQNNSSLSSTDEKQLGKTPSPNSKKIDGNLKGLERRYHLLYLKAIEVQCLFEGLLTKKNSASVLSRDSSSAEDTDDEPVSKLARLSDSESDTHASCDLLTCGKTISDDNDSKDENDDGDDEHEVSEEEQPSNSRDWPNLSFSTVITTENIEKCYNTATDFDADSEGSDCGEVVLKRRKNDKFFVYQHRLTNKQSSTVKNDLVLISENMDSCNTLAHQSKGGNDRPLLDINNQISDNLQNQILIAHQNRSPKSVVVAGGGGVVGSNANGIFLTPTSGGGSPGLRKRQRNVDASKFNRSNRKSKNCAIFYFKHTDTDNETNFGGGLSSNGSDVLKSAEPSSDDDEGWLYTNTDCIDGIKSTGLVSGNNENNSISLSLNDNDSDKENKEIEKALALGRNSSSSIISISGVSGGNHSSISGTYTVVSEIQINSTTTIPAPTPSPPHRSSSAGDDNNSAMYHHNVVDLPCNNNASRSDANGNQECLQSLLASTSSSSLNHSSGEINDQSEDVVDNNSSSPSTSNKAGQFQENEINNLNSRKLLTVVDEATTTSTTVAKPSELMSSSPPAKEISHESIKELVLEVEHLVRDEALKTPTKKHPQIKISSTVKKREVDMSEPTIQKVQEWLEHQPMKDNSLYVPNTDCEASGEASETDSVARGSDTSEGFTDSVATCMQTGSTSNGNSTEIIGGSAEPIANVGSNQSLNVGGKVIRRQNRRKADRPWSVSCLSQCMTQYQFQYQENGKTSSPQAGLASHSISESALDSLSPIHSKKNGVPQTPIKNSDSKGSLKRRKTRKKKQLGKRSDSGSDGLPPIKPLSLNKYVSGEVNAMKELTTNLSLLSLPKSHGEKMSSEQESEEDYLKKPNFRVGSLTTAYMTSETKLGSLAALANYIHDEDHGGAYNTGTEDHNSSFSETAWDNYQEKYNSENYSEGVDSDGARRLQECDDYRNFLDSQSDCCSSLSAANNLDSFSPPRMDSLQQNETRGISQETIASSVDHARRRRALELEYERRRKTMEMKRKSSQDDTVHPRSPSTSVSSTNAATPKNLEKFTYRFVGESANRKLDFGTHIHNSWQSIRRTSESDTSSRRRKLDDRRRSSRTLEKSFKPIPVTTSSSNSDSDDEEKEMMNVLAQSRIRLEEIESLKIRSHLLRPEDYAEIISTCRDNIHCLEAVLTGPPGTMLSTNSVNVTRDLLSSWENLLSWSENAAAARKMQEEMITLKNSFNRLGSKSACDLDSESSIQIAIEELKNEKTELQTYRTSMLRLNASVHSWLTRHEVKIQKDRLNMQSSETENNRSTSAGTDTNGNNLSTGDGTETNNVAVEQEKASQIGSTVVHAECEFHKHLKDEVSEMYSAWDEADARINMQLEVLTASLIAWRQLETGLSEFHQVLGKDRGTLKGLEGALDNGKTTPVELAQNVKLVAKLLSEKVEISQQQLAAVQEHLDPNHILHIAQFTSASNGSLSDSGISDGGTTSDGGLSERERRLGMLRRLAKQLETALAPGSDAMKSIAARMEAAESELKTLQNTCRELIVRTAVSQDKKAQSAFVPATNGEKSPQRQKKSPKRSNKRGKQFESAVASVGSKKAPAQAQEVKFGAVSPDSGDPNDPEDNEIFEFSSDDESKPKNGGWAWRIARMAFPMQVALLTLLCAACIMQPNCCDNLNNLSMSFTPQLRYIRGPPPI